MPLTSRWAILGLVLLGACSDSNTAPATGAIAGTVTSVRLGALAVRVHATPGTGAADSAQTDSVTGAFGPIQLAVGAATAQVSAGPNGCTLPVSQPATVAANQTATANIVVNCDAAMIYGRLGNVTRGRFPGVTVSVSVDGGTAVTTQTDRGGLFSFDTGVSSPGTNAMSVAVTIASGLPASCTTPAGQVLSLPRGASLEVLFTITCS